MRPAFLFLPLVSIFYAVMTIKVDIDFTLLGLICLAGVLANISVNALNEYQDFASGLDFRTERTPFSGGSGGLVAVPSQAKNVFILAVIAILLLVAIGGYFVYLRGAVLVPFGLFGLVIIITYTRWLNKLPLLCLIAPGLGIGLMMVMGTQFVLTATYSFEEFLLALLPFCLINNLLLLNQYPDIEADKSVGRFHFPIAYGISASNAVYALFLAASIVLVGFYVQQQLLPLLSLIALAPLSLSVISLMGAIKYRAKIAQHLQFMTMNVMATLLTPVCAVLPLLF